MAECAIVHDRSGMYASFIHQARIIHGQLRNPSRVIGELDRRTLRAEELAGDVEGLAADNNDLLTAQKLLGDNRGQTAKEMALAINDDLEEESMSVVCPVPSVASCLVPYRECPSLAS